MHGINIETFKDINIWTREKYDMDILIKIGKVFIIIESKYRGAKDQDKQIEKYYREIIATERALEDNVYILYLNAYIQCF
jgi:hypothetical protein